MVITWSGAAAPQVGVPAVFPGSTHNIQSHEHLKTSASTEKRDVQGIEMVPKPQSVRLDQAPDLKHP